MNYLRVKGVITEGYKPDRDTYEVTIKLGKRSITTVTHDFGRYIAAPITEVYVKSKTHETDNLGALAGFPYPWKVTDFRTGRIVGTYPNHKALAKELVSLREKRNHPLVVEHRKTGATQIRMPLAA